MSIRRFDLDAGGDSFAFLSETEPKIHFWLAKYPEDRKRSAVIPMLWLAQKDNGGWLSEPAMREVADRLEMPYIRVYEVATFYTMFNLKPVGKHHIQLCGTTPCMLRGANDLKQVCERKIGKKERVTDDGRLSWVEVECLGACVNAPMIQINDYYYEDLTAEVLEDILDKLANGVDVPPGTFVDRDTSAPAGTATSLEDGALYDGSKAAPLMLPNLPEGGERQGEAMLNSSTVSSAVHVSGSAPGTEREVSSLKSTTEVPVGRVLPGVSPTQLFLDSLDRPQSTKASIWGEQRADTFGATTSFAMGRSEDVPGEQPEGLAAARAGGPDDLKRISGVGPVIEEKLNKLGIFHFDQIAAWTRTEVAWVDGFLTFKGRIDREDWISQARILADEAARS